MVNWILRCIYHTIYDVLDEFQNKKNNIYLLYFRLLSGRSLSILVFLLLLLHLLTFNSDVRIRSWNLYVTF